MCYGKLIERAERFVHQKNFRVESECPRQRQLCCMPPDNSRGNLLSKPSNPTMLSNSKRGIAALDPQYFERQRHVSQHSPPGQQRRILKHPAEDSRRPGLRRRTAANGDHTFRRLHQVADDFDERGLAAPAGPDNRNKRALIDTERNVRKSWDGARFRTINFPTPSAQMKGAPGTYLLPGFGVEELAAPPENCVVNASPGSNGFSMTFSSARRS